MINYFLIKIITIMSNFKSTVTHITGQPRFNRVEQIFGNFALDLRHKSGGFHVSEGFLVK